MGKGMGAWAKNRGKHLGKRGSGKEDWRFASLYDFMMSMIWEQQRSCYAAHGV